MGDLTKNFSDWEFTCRHCGMEGVMPELVDALQALRDRLDAQVHISSGYRCPEHPLSAGRPGSRHITSEAADIVVTGRQPSAVAETAALFEQFGGIAVDPHRGYVHVDIRERVATHWSYDENGKVVAA